jgi:predicted transcriptional regulator of viral defense system
MLNGTTRAKIQASFRALNSAILRPSEVAKIFHENRTSWNLPKHVNASNVIAFLLTEAGLRDVSLISTSDYPSINRYAWSTISPYELALSARSNTFFSHGTALYLHKLVSSNANTLYVNQEQTAKATQSSVLSQEGIDRAFSNRQRLSTYELKYRDLTIVLLNGKNTARLGVAHFTGPKGEQLPTTNLERTLLDVTVRPAYAGGIANVFEAFRLARPLVTADQIVSTLLRLGHAYPYHQAVGFLMERAGFPDADLRTLEELGMAFNFYLVHGAHQTRYSERWRLFYPRDV